MDIIGQSQIHSVFISLIINGQQYGTVGTLEDSWSPQAITSLKVEKVTPGRNFTADGYKFTIQMNYLMIPDFYEDLLKLIKASSDGLVSASLQYGYISDNGTSDLCSPVYNLKLLTCMPDDLWRSLTLTFIQVDNTNSYNLFTDTTKELLDNNSYNNLSDYVRTIAEGQGWKIGHIEPTIPYEGEIKRDNSINSPVMAINELLTRYPNESTKGEGRYVCGFKHNINESVFYFVPTESLQPDSNYGYIQYASTYEFFYNALPQGKVKQFTPKFVSSLVEATGSGNSTIDRSALQFEERPDLAVITTDTREIHSIEYNMESNRVYDKSISETESYSGYMNPGHVLINIDSANLLNYMRSIIKESINNYVNVIGIRTSAEMEILGDPSLDVMDYILVIPMYPQDSYNNPGKIHPSGGVYQILKISDTISNGEFSTNLLLRAVGERDFKLGEVTSYVMDYEALGRSAQIEVKPAEESQTTEELTENTDIIEGEDVDIVE